MSVCVSVLISKIMCMQIKVGICTCVMFVKPWSLFLGEWNHHPQQVKYWTNRFNIRRIETSGSCIYIKTNITKTTNGKQTTPLKYLKSLCRQLVMHLSRTHKLDLEQIVIPPEISPIHEIFFIPNLTTVLSNERESTEEYIYIQVPGRHLRQIHANIYRHSVHCGLNS